VLPYYIVLSWWGGGGDLPIWFDRRDTSHLSFIFVLSYIYIYIYIYIYSSPLLNFDPSMYIYTVVFSVKLNVPGHLKTVYCVNKTFVVFIYLSICYISIFNVMSF